MQARVGGRVRASARGWSAPCASVAASPLPLAASSAAAAAFCSVAHQTQQQHAIVPSVAHTRRTMCSCAIPLGAHSVRRASASHWASACVSHAGGASRRAFSSQSPQPSSSTPPAGAAPASAPPFSAGRLVIPSVGGSGAAGASGSLFGASNNNGGSPAAGLGLGLGLGGAGQQAVPRPFTFTLPGVNGANTSATPGFTAPSFAAPGLAKPAPAAAPSVPAAAAAATPTQAQPATPAPSTFGFHLPGVPAPKATPGFHLPGVGAAAVQSPFSGGSLFGQSPSTPAATAAVPGAATAANVNGNVPPPSASQLMSELPQQPAAPPLFTFGGFSKPLANGGAQGQVAGTLLPTGTLPLTGGTSLWTNFGLTTPSDGAATTPAPGTGLGLGLGGFSFPSAATAATPAAGGRSAFEEILQKAKNTKVQIAEAREEAAGQLADMLPITKAMRAAAARIAAPLMPAPPKSDQENRLEKRLSQLGVGRARIAAEAEEEGAEEEAEAEAEADGLSAAARAARSRSRRVKDAAEEDASEAEAAAVEARRQARWRASCAKREARILAMSQEERESYVSDRLMALDLDVEVDLSTSTHAVAIAHALASLAQDGEFADMEGRERRDYAEQRLVEASVLALENDSAPRGATVFARSPRQLPLYLTPLESRIVQLRERLEQLLQIDQYMLNKRLAFERQKRRMEGVLQQLQPGSVQHSQHAAYIQSFVSANEAAVSEGPSKRAAIEEEMSTLERSLQQTSNFFRAHTSHLHDSLRDGQSLTMHDEQPFSVNEQSRLELIQAERERKAELTMLREQAHCTPLQWWTQMQAVMRAKHERRCERLARSVLGEKSSLQRSIDAVDQEGMNAAQLKHAQRAIASAQREEREAEEEEEEEDDEYDVDASPLSLEALVAQRQAMQQQRVKQQAVEEDKEEEEEDAADDAENDFTVNEVFERAERDSAVLRSMDLGASLGSAQRELAAKLDDMRPNREVAVFNVQTMASLAERMGVSVRQLAVKLRELDLDTARGSHSVLREDAARLVIEELGFIPVRGAEVIQPQVVASLRRKAMKSEEYLALPHRPPVIAVMGHVDHGKTSLLDRLRTENRAAGEAGGITQSIGAFRVDLRPKEDIDASENTEVDAEGKPLYATFLDTPGHAAFKNMRARGASSHCTDLVILVISAVDGLQPQTLEVLQLARQNNMPLIIAVNKCDIKGADPDAVLKQLEVHDVVVEARGGEVLSCNISAKTGDGIDELKELIRISSEVLQLHASRDTPGEAYVIESRVMKQGGCVANLLVRNGSLRVGQHFVCGLQHGKIRALHDEHNRPVKGAVYPGQAVQLSGLKSLDDLTDDLYIVDSEELALRIIAERQELLGLDENELVGSEQSANQRDQKAQAYKIQISRRKQRIAIRPLTAEESAAKALQDNSVPLLVKADVSGSLEVLLDYFSKLPRDEVIASVVKAGLGEISAADVQYVSEMDGDAAIVGFNVKVSSDAALLAKQKGIPIYTHPVIYTVWDDVRDLLSAKLPAELEDVQLGEATVQQLFELSANGGKKKQKADAAAAAAGDADAAQDNKAIVAGCRVKSGKIDAKMKFRIKRDEEVVFEGSCTSLRVNRDAKPFVEKGNECGIRLSSGSDSIVQVGDIIECYTIAKKKRTLDDSAARGFHTGPGEDEFAQFYDSQ